MARVDGETPGDGKTSPYGDGTGASTGVPRVSGANDFSRNPTGNGTKTGGRDFIAETNLNHAQPKGPLASLNPTTVPPGGRMLALDPKGVSGTIAGNSQRKPFKLKGGNPAEMAPAAGPSAMESAPAMGEAGDAPGDEFAGSLALAATGASGFGQGRTRLRVRGLFPRVLF